MKRLLLAVCLVFITTISHAITYNDILFQIRTDIQDSTATYRNPILTDNLIKSRINVVNEQICSYTLAVSTRILISPVTGQQEYGLPSDFVKIKRVAFISTSGSTTTYKRLEQTSLDQLDVNPGGMWENNPANLPKQYYLRHNNIGLYPKPSGTYSQANAIKIDYYKRPKSMSASTDEPFDGLYTLKEYHHVVILGTVAWCKRTLGIDNTRETAEYKFWLDEMKTKIKYIQDFDGVIETQKDYNGGR